MALGTQTPPASPRTPPPAPPPPVRPKPAPSRSNPIAPVSALLAPRRLGRRLPPSRSPRLLGLELTTPVVLRILEVLTVTAVAVFLVVTTYAFASARSTFTDAGDRISMVDGSTDAKGKQPAATAALDIQYALSDMDAHFTSQFLVRDQTDLGVTRASAVQAFNKSRSATSLGIVEATRRLDPGDDEAAVRDLISRTPEYQSHVDQALNAQTRGDDELALDEYRRATELMQGALLPAAQRLATANVNELNATSTRQQNEVTTVGTIVTVVVVICFVMLVASQAFLFRRTRRTLNFGLIAATVLLAGGIGMAGAGLSSASTNLQTATNDAFGSIVQLKQARAALYEARADEIRWLLDRERAGLHEANFYARSNDLLRSGDGVAGEAYSGVIKKARDNPDVLRSDPCAPGRCRPVWVGYLAESYRSKSFTGEETELRTMVVTYEEFQRGDIDARRSFDADPKKAIRTMVSTSSSAPFYKVDQALERAVGINDQRFNQAIDSGGKVALLWQIVLPFVALLCIALIILGFRPRIAEYQRS